MFSASFCILMRLGSYKQVVLSRFSVFLWVLCMCIAGSDMPLYAQKKTANKKSPATPSKEPAKPDTVIVIHEDNKPAPPPAMGVEMRTTQKVIVIDKATGKPKVPDTAAKRIRPVDTVIVLKPGRKKGVDEDEDETNAATKVVRINDNCRCMKLDVKASDTLRPDDYVNYQFFFKNNCKESVWISSSGFRFLVFLKNGTPAKMLRKLDYVKQYNYPDFVQLKPGEEYTFMFGDDAFYQYDLHRGWEYKFTFTYYNNLKYRKAPTKTYLCSEFRDKMIFIK